MKRKSAALCGIFFAFCLPLTVWGGDDLSKGEILRILMQTAPGYTSYISEEDIVSGYNEGDFRDDKLATDVEMLVMLSRAFPSMEKPKGNNYITLPEKAGTDDLPEWARKHFDYLNSRGIISSSLVLDDSVTMPELELYLRRIWRYYGSEVKDDFYASVNKSVLDSARPGIDVYSNHFVDAAHNSSRQVRDIIYDIVKKGAPTKEEQKIKSIYLSALEMQRGDGDMSPLKPYLKRIDDAKSIKELSQALLYCDENIYMTGLLDFDLGVDPKNADRYIPVLSLSQPSFEYSEYETDEHKEAFIKYIKTLLMLAGESSTNAEAAGESIYRFEKAVSPHCLKDYEYSEIEKTYNLMTLDELQQWFDYLDLAEIARLDGLELGPGDEILVEDLGLAYNMALGCKSNLNVAKQIAKVNLTAQYGETLSMDCVEAGEKYKSEVTGLPDDALSVQERAVKITKNCMSEYLSRIYNEKYFSEEDKAGVEAIVDRVKAVYREKLSSCGWMSAKTKEKAIKKLDNMGVKIGYSPAPYDYMENAEISYDNSLFKNSLAILKAYNAYKGRMQKQAADRETWPCAAYEANAFYMAVRNEMVLPSGIMQAPFYSSDASIEENMAGIGTIISHEISHAFDSSGAGFDERGSYKNWWTEEDRRKFSEKCSDIEAFYDGIETVTDVMTNGRLTIGEDIADLGSVVCAAEALRQYEGADMEKFYYAYANVWAEISTRDYIEYYSLNDEHPGSNVRVNLSLANSKDFIETFGIEEGDGMYVPENKRVGLW